MRKLTIKFTSVIHMVYFLRQLKTRDYDILFGSNEVVGNFSCEELRYAVVELKEEAIYEDGKPIILGCDVMD